MSCFAASGLGAPGGSQRGQSLVAHSAGRRAAGFERQAVAIPRGRLVNPGTGG